MSKLTKADFKNITTLSDLLTAKYGKRGTEKREDFESETREMIIMARLAELREAQKITQRELSEETSLAIAMISRIENKKGNPTLATFIKIVDALNLSNKQILHLMGR